MKKIYAVFLLTISFFALHATHIVGGYISYRYISGTTYEVKLTIYRDCLSATPFDGAPGSLNNAFVGVFEENTNNLVSSMSLANPVVTVIQPPNNPCLQSTANVCVEQGVYTFNVTLPDGNTGYTIVHERCCRNGTITNVFAPGDQGAVYSAYIPPTNTYHNTNPVFNILPPLFICVNSPLVFNYSATDADGDQLTYSLCTPFTAGDPQFPAPNPPNGPPYLNIPWQTNYSTANMLGGNPPLLINPTTGMLTGTPNSIGQFVVGVCVSEFRNGVLLGTYLRDFQFNVTQCNSPVANIPSTDINPQTGIGLYVQNCKNLTVTFQNHTYNPPPTNVPLTYHWDFGVPHLTNDTSNQQFPTYVYPDTGTYLVKLIAVKGSGPQPCTDTTYAYVKIYPTFTADFTTNNICRDSLAQFTDLSVATHGTVNSWSWNFGDGSSSTQFNPVHLYPSAGNYTVTFVGETDLGCRDTIQKNITVFPQPIVTASEDTSVCLNGANFRDSVELNASGGVSYEWSPATGLNSASVQNPIAKPIVNTTYYVTATDANGCRAFDSVTVDVLDPSLNIIVDEFKNVCIYDTVRVSATSQGESIYAWTPLQNITDETTLNPAFFPTTTTSYVLTVSNYCYTKDDTVEIIVLPLPTLSFSNIDSICYGDSLQISVSGGLTYEWISDGTISPLNVSNPVVSPNSSRYYSVNAVDANGCKNSDSVFVNVVALPFVNAGNDTLVFRDTPALLDASTDGTTFYWEPTSYLHNPNLLRTTAELPETQSYILFAENDFGCVNHDTVVIFVEVNTLLMIPTAFSPNGDGVNDVFRIVRYLNISKLKVFEVYNRWGEKVFETSDINEGWDGTYQNREQEIGVYVWYAIALTKDGEEFVRKGNVTLVR